MFPEILKTIQLCESLGKQLNWDMGKEKQGHGRGATLLVLGK